MSGWEPDAHPLQALPGPLPSPSWSFGGLEQMSSQGGDAWDGMGTCCRGRPLAPDTMSSSCLVPRPEDGRSSAELRVRGGQSRRRAQPLTPNQLCIGTPRKRKALCTHSIYSASTRHHHGVCQCGGTTHQLRRLGGPRESLGHCRGDKRDGRVGQRGAEGGLADACRGQELAFLEGTSQREPERPRERWRLPH